MLDTLALLCRVLGWYPFWLLLLSLCPPETMLPCMGILTGIALVTTFCSQMLRHMLHERKVLSFRLSIIWTVLSAAVCAALCALISGSTAIAVLLSALTVAGSHRKCDADTGDLFTVNSYAAFLTCTVIAAVMLAAAHQNTHISMTLGVIGGISAAYLLLRNQLMLRRFVNRRSSVETAVPAEIRRGNLMLVGGIILLLAVVFIFHTPLTHFLEWLHHSMIRLVTAIVQFFFRIIERFSGEAPAEAEEVLFEEEAGLPQAAGRSNPLWLLLWIPFITIAYIVWREFLSDWVYDLKMFILDFIAGLRKKDTHRRTRRIENGEYFDNETKLERERSAHSRRRLWRKALMQWKAMPESNAKFYAGYRLLLDAPCWQEGMLKDADTVREVRDKWAAYYKPEKLLDAVTADFHADRYAETGLPPEAIADLWTALTYIKSKQPR